MLHHKFCSYKNTAVLDLFLRCFCCSQRPLLYLHRFIIKNNMRNISWILWAAVMPVSLHAIVEERPLPENGSPSYDTPALSWGQAEYENPLVNSINREPYAVTSISFASTDEALKVDRETSSRFHSLNGLWKFKFITEWDQLPADFMSENLDDTNWDIVPVPST